MPKSKKEKKKHINVAFFQSRFQTRRMLISDHLYIDGTFNIAPKGTFSQLIVLLTHDIITKCLIPVGFFLMNSKHEKAYDMVFEMLKSVYCEEGEEDKTNYLNLFKSITIDFESAIHKSFSKIFPDKRTIGCLYHFVSNLNKHASKCNIDIKSKEYLDIRKEIVSLCWKEKEILKESLTKIYKDCKGLAEDYKKFIKYFIKQWVPKILKNLLYYKDINQKYRSNSAIESYNSKIKKKLPTRPNFQDLLVFLQLQESKAWQKINYLEKRGDKSQTKSKRKKYDSREENSCESTSSKFYSLSSSDTDSGNGTDQKDNKQQYSDVFTDNSSGSNSELFTSEESYLNKSKISLTDSDSEVIEKSKQSPDAGKRKSNSSITNIRVKVFRDNNGEIKKVCDVTNLIWIKWYRQSCRIDVFLTIFTLGLYNRDV